MTESLRTVTTTRLRSDLSEVINLAAYGGAPVIVTRRSLKVAAVVSVEDLKLLMRMQKKREELRNRPMPSDPEKVGLELAARLREEMFFDS
jgi:prevent-host-death family protein